MILILTFFQRKAIFLCRVRWGNMKLEGIRKSQFFSLKTSNDRTYYCYVLLFVTVAIFLFDIHAKNRTFSYSIKRVQKMFHITVL